VLGFFLVRDLPGVVSRGPVLPVPADLALPPVPIGETRHVRNHRPLPLRDPPRAQDEAVQVGLAVHPRRGGRAPSHAGVASAGAPCQAQPCHAQQPGRAQRRRRPSGACSQGRHGDDLRDRLHVHDPEAREAPLAPEAPGTTQ